MDRALEIRDAPTAEKPRARAARRLLAIANALDGMSRADAMKAAGRERQALRGEPDQETVLRIASMAHGRPGNVERRAGVGDRPLPGRPPALGEAELALLFDPVFRSPDPETDGVRAWTLPGLCR